MILTWEQLRLGKRRPHCPGLSQPCDPMRNDAHNDTEGSQQKQPHHLRGARDEASP